MQGASRLYILYCTCVFECPCVDLHVFGPPIPVRLCRNNIFNILDFFAKPHATAVSCKTISSRKTLHLPSTRRKGKPNNMGCGTYCCTYVLPTYNTRGEARQDGPWYILLRTHLSHRSGKCPFPEP